MFIKIKKIGICCALFMALFSMENDVANCASFRCNARQYSYNGVGWGTGGQLLDAAILKAHLNNQGNNALKELARLILAQGGANIPNHNIPNNHNIDYIIPPQLQLQQLLEQRQQLQLLQLLQQPQQLLNQMMGNLTDTVQYVRQHIFNRHTGRIPGKGYFNVDVNFIMNDVDNIIKALFSENITFLSCGEIRIVLHGTEQFAIDVVYNGPNIPGLQPNQSIGITSNGLLRTNTVRVVVGVRNGRIRLVTIYPPD